MDNMFLHGRRVIRIDEVEINEQNIVRVLQKALTIHNENRVEIQYLWNYYRGKQPIEDRIKLVRPEINNKVVINRAEEIVAFKTGYLVGEPLQYVARGEDADDGKLSDINHLNDMMFAEEKSAKDKEIADWFHICGTAYRIILPDVNGQEDESPFEHYVLDPRNTFVVYSAGMSQEPLMGVHYVTDEDGNIRYGCYTKDSFYEIVNGVDITQHMPHVLGEIPIIEYPLNIARIGAFELVLPILDAINNVESNRLDGLEQFVQSLLLFHNVDISSDDYTKLREDGAIKFKDIDPQLRADVRYITNSLDQGETQTLVDNLYQTVLTICGMPCTGDGKTSDSSNNGAVILRNGWQTAEARAKDSELMFKRSERRFLKIVLNIARTLSDIDLRVADVEIRFTRRNYEAILEKAQVLTMLLSSNKVHPRLAFEHCGMFPDPDLAYTMSDEYHEEQERMFADENRTDSEDDRTDPTDSATRKQSGAGD